MKISRRQLRKILRKSLLKEGILDDISQGIDYFFQDDKEDTSSKAYQASDASASNTKEIERASDAAGITGKVLAGIGWSLQAAKKILAMAGIEELQETVMERSGIPIHIGCLYNFIALKQSTFELDSGKSTRAMYYVCKSAAKNGRKSKIHYEDFYQGQLLDPKVGPDKAESIVYSAKPDGYDQINPNIYGQLSLAFGSANYKKSGDGFYVSDRYDFNLDKHKKSWASTDGYVPVIENISKVVGGNILEILKIFANKVPVIDIEVTGSLYKLIEDICLMYMTSFKYKGFMLTCKTMSAAEVEEDAGAQSAKSSASKSSRASESLDDSVFPGGNWSNEKWEDFVDDYVDEDSLPEGITLQKIKTDWSVASGVLGYSGNISGINEFIFDAKKRKI
jgi:hypothetical protein